MEWAKLHRLWCKRCRTAAMQAPEREKSAMGKLEDMDNLLAGRHFDREVIILCVRWYVRFKLSAAGRWRHRGSRAGSAPVRPVTRCARNRSLPPATLVQVTSKRPARRRRTRPASAALRCVRIRHRSLLCPARVFDRFEVWIRRPAPDTQHNPRSTTAGATARQSEVTVTMPSPNSMRISAGFDRISSLRLRDV